MINHVDGQVDVEFRPVYRVGTKALHVRDLLHSGFRKPGECIEGQVMRGLGLASSSRYGFEFQSKGIEDLQYGTQTWISLS